jgi:ATP-binding cassette subfamily F protein 3
MRQALTVALQSFEGGLIVVSHDRHLIKSVADSLWLVADGKLREFAGDLDDYQQWLRSHGAPHQAAPTGKSAAAKGTAPGNKKAAAGKSAAPLKVSSRPDPLTRLRQQLNQVESRIAAVAAERALLEAELAANPDEPRLAMRRANLERDLGYLENQWMEIGTAIEAAGG